MAPASASSSASRAPSSAGRAASPAGAAPDAARAVRRRHHGLHVELAAVVHRDGAERQLAAAAERRHDRALGVEARAAPRHR